MSLIFFIAVTTIWTACTDDSKQTEMGKKTLHEARDDVQHNKGNDSIHDAVDLQTNDSAGMKIGGNELDSKKK